MKSISIMFFAFVVFDLSMMEETDCTGPNCEQIISMPLLDKMEATLKADLDVRKLINFLKRFISREVKTEIADTMPDAILKIMNESLLKVKRLESRLDELIAKQKIKEDMGKSNIITYYYSTLLFSYKLCSTVFISI